VGKEGWVEEEEVGEGRGICVIGFRGMDTLQPLSLGLIIESLISGH